MKYKKSVLRNALKLYDKRTDITLIIEQININEIFYWSKNKKHIEGYGFVPFDKKFRDKYSRKLMDTATKTETDAASKGVV